MPRIKSLVISTKIDTVARAHKCRGNSSHILQRGDKCLEVKDGRNRNRYCLACAKRIVERDLNKLRELQKSLESQ